MSIDITFNGVEYSIPEFRDTNYANDLTQFFVAIPNGSLQPTGGLFTLLAEVDFGASFGVKSLYVKSRAASPAAAGIFRLGNAETISWRNALNNGDLPLTVNASNELLYNGAQVLTGAGPSSYVSSITGTANQVVASGATGAVTLSLPQSIATTSNLRFGSLTLNGAADASALLTLASTTQGFLPPRMTTAQRNLIASPAEGLTIYNTSTGQMNLYAAGVWTALTMSAGGTVNAGTQYMLGYYAANGTAISGLTAITPSLALVADANGLPVASTVTTTELQAIHALTASRALTSDGSGLIAVSAVTSTELGYVAGVTSALQTQLNLKAPLASPTFSGTITTPLTASRALVTGASSELAVSAVTAAELAFVGGVTSAIQTQLNTKSTDTLVVHLAGSETITGAKTFQDQKLLLQETGGTDVVTINVAALAASRAYTLPDAGASASFLMSAGAQTITGAKTFASSSLLLQEVSSTDVVTVAVAALAASRIYTVPDAGGDVNLTFGSAWASYTPASSWTANTTVTGKWRRIGDSIDIDIKVACSGAPTSAALTVDLPSGLTIDTAKLVDAVAGQTMIGMAEIIDAGVAFYMGAVLYSDTDTMAVRYMDDAAAAVTINGLTQAAPITFGNGDYVLIKVRGLPITGWGA